ncbi:MAG TPA: phage tail tip lysozyme [Candidatus Saccharimonadales bacterium]|nr:phage tail tip lysozyme [Candidatus Saccharimonadales bacterium]
MNNVKRIFLLAVTCSFVFSSLVSTYSVTAADTNPFQQDCKIPDKNNPDICLDDFFQSNNIIYYDPNAKECTLASASDGDGTMTGNSNAEKIFTYLVGKGLNAAQAAGFLGNMQQESGFDPAIRQGGRIASDNFVPINGEGFGLVQWTFTDRQRPLVNLARSTNRKITDISLQMDYVWKELNGGWKTTLDQLKGVTDPIEAAIIVHDNYEISADTPAAVRAIRGGNATKFYNQYKNLAPSSSSSSSAGGCNAESEGGLTDFMGKDFVIYNQCQYPPYGGAWGTKPTLGGRDVCYDGCIPTSLAMISKNLAGRNVDPGDTTTYYTKNGHWARMGGSSTNSPMSAAGAFGLRVEIINNKGNINAYREVFKKGGLIMAMSTGSSPFMASRHAIVLRGITAEGNFMIADPGQTNTNKAPANQPSTNKILSDIRSDSFSISYAFYKQ